MILLSDSEIAQFSEARQDDPGQLAKALLANALWDAMRENERLKKENAELISCINDMRIGL